MGKPNKTTFGLFLAYQPVLSHLYEINPKNLNCYGAFTALTFPPFSWHIHEFQGFQTNIQFGGIRKITLLRHNQ